MAAGIVPQQVGYRRANGHQVHRSGPGRSQCRYSAATTSVLPREGVVARSLQDDIHAAVGRVGRKWSELIIAGPSLSSRRMTELTGPQTLLASWPRI